jgi:hypothetical protein
MKLVFISMVTTPMSGVVAARGRGHGHVQQGHRRTAVRHVKGIEVLGLGLVVQLRLATFHAVQREAQVADKGDFGTKTFQNNSSVYKLRDARKAGQGQGRLASAAATLPGKAGRRGKAAHNGAGAYSVNRP